MLTKSLVMRMFRELWNLTAGEYRGDGPAKSQAWNDYCDALCKTGRITSKQYSNWSNPF